MTPSASPLVLSRNFAEIRQCLHARFPWIRPSVVLVLRSCPDPAWALMSECQVAVLTLRQWARLSPVLSLAVKIFYLPCRLLGRLKFKNTATVFNILFEH